MYMPVPERHPLAPHDGEDFEKGLPDTMLRSREKTMGLDLLSVEPALELMRVMPLEGFKQLGHIPRYGNKLDFRHPVSGQPNECLAVPLRQIWHKRNKCVVIFVSHRWLRPHHVPIKGHPDTENDEKFDLIVKGLERFVSAMVPAAFEVRRNSPHSSHCLVNLFFHVWLIVCQLKNMDTCS
eukprot:5550726-Pyramimonas_sp.AAC.1